MFESDGGPLRSLTAGLTCVVSVVVVRLSSDIQLGSINEPTRYVSIGCRVLHSICSAYINSKVKKTLSLVSRSAIAASAPVPIVTANLIFMFCRGGWLIAAVDIWRSARPYVTKIVTAGTIYDRFERKLVQT